MSQARMIRVMIADDHDLLRGGIAMLLQTYPDIKLIGEASNGIDAVELSNRLRPDVILMDLRMPEMDGTAATRLIRQQCPNTQVVVLSSYADEELVQSALSAGAISYLVKSCSIELLINAIHDAIEGKATLSRQRRAAPANTTVYADQPGTRSSQPDGAGVKQQPDCRTAHHQPFDSQEACQQCADQASHHQPHRGSGNCGT
jgi:two-component system, NarL family, response regulator LiaR